MEAIQRHLALADDEVGSTGIYLKAGTIYASWEYSDVEHSAVLDMYNSNGTPTTLVSAYNTTYVDDTDTDTKMCFYFVSGQLVVKNRLGGDCEVDLLVIGQSR